MNKEKQRIKIAEACGWTGCIHVESINLTKGFPPVGYMPSYGTYENGMAQLRNYPEDLNAMHEAKKLLLDNQWEIYAGHLAKFHKPLTSFKFLNATAEQEAEAFLRTIGQWEEEAINE